MSSKTKSNSTSTMSYGFQNVPETQDVTAARTAATEDAGSDPSLKYNYARQLQDINNTMSNPFGANYSPETAEAMQYTRKNDLGQQYGQQLLQDSYNRKQRKFNNLYAVAGLTQPRMVQTGGTTTGVVSQPMWPGLLSGGISAGLGAI